MVIATMITRSRKTGRHSSGANAGSLPGERPAGLWHQAPHAAGSSGGWSSLYAVLVLTMLFMLQGCETGTEPQINGEGNGDPDLPSENVSFTDHVSPILQNNCVQCHGSNGESGIDLRTYDSVMESTSAQYGSEIVIPGDAENSPLYDKLQPNPEHGDRMPQGGSLDEDKIQAIGTWIDEGAEDN